MSSRGPGSRASHRQLVVEQASSARPKAARHSTPDVHHSTRHDLDRDIHAQTSISALHRAVEPVPDEAAQLAKSGWSWHDRFEKSHDLDDLQRAIEARERAFELMPENHPRRLWLLHGLSLSVGHRFDHLGNLDDLERSITLAKQAVDRTPEDDPDYTLRLSGLAVSLHARYEHLGDLHDLRDSIAKSKAALRLTPENHPDRPRQLSNLGMSLRLLFERLGEIHDIEEAIATHRRAVDLTPEGHPDLPWRLDGLASSLSDRFERLGEIRDLDEAIALSRCSVELTPEGDPEHPTRLSNLAVSLSARFERLGDAHDLDETIAVDLLSVKLTPESHPDRALSLSNLASSLDSRFKRFGNTQDLEEGVKTHTQAVKLMSEGHPDQPRQLNNLAISLRLRYKRLEDVRDLEGAIDAHRLALDSTPKNHPDRPVRLYSFGLTLKAQFKGNKSKGHFDDALDCFMEATMQQLGNPISRLKSARQCVSLLSEHPRFSSAELVLSAHSRIIEIFPEIVWLGHSLERRYQELAKLGPEVNATISAFIKLQSRFQAIEWMEAGRTFVWAQMFSLREPLDELESAHPQLAADLRKLSSALQQSGSGAQPSLGHSGSKSEDGAPFIETAARARPGVGTIDSAADRQRQLAIEYDKLLKDIRSKAGFENFLRSAKISSLLTAIGRLDGPVVFINVHSSSCDALALSPDGGIDHIPLSRLSEKTAQTMRLRWVEVLRWSGRDVRTAVSPLVKDGPDILCLVLEKLWTLIVHPVLKALNLIIDDPSALHRLPHVTWCPMGPLTQLPLHAAGIYGDTQALSHVYDFVVSSYTPSLSALLRCHKQAGTDWLSHPNVLIIAQPETPGLKPLPNTHDECRRLHKMLPHHKRSVLLHNIGTVANTLNTMNRNPWVHIACHGIQDRTDPTQSQFALYDGPLTLSALMSKVADSAELAFLSACQTAVGDENLPEESVHLAAGMLAVGFKGVAATMWSIGDADAPIVVEAYYKKLLELRKSGQIAAGYTGAAYAMHDAVMVLRKHVGEQNFVQWAPFIHLGV